MPIVRVVVVLVVFVVVATVPVVVFVVVALMVITVGIDEIDLGIPASRNNGRADHRAGAGIVIVVMVVAANFAAAEGDHRQDKQAASAREDSGTD